MSFDQNEYDLRCEWGEAGIAALAATSDVVVVVDVLSFSTCVDIAVARGVEVLPFRSRDDTAREFARCHGAFLALARGEGAYSLSPSSFLDARPGTRVVLPSPNGAALTLAVPGLVVFAGCLRNATAVSRTAAQVGARIAVVPAGERWPDGALRPCLEDWLGAGAIIEKLPGTRSPEARAAAELFRAIRDDLTTSLRECASGRELISRGYERDVGLAGEVDCSECAPRFRSPAYVAGG